MKNTREKLCSLEQQALNVHQNLPALSKSSSDSQKLTSISLHPSLKKNITLRESGLDRERKYQREETTSVEMDNLLSAIWGKKESVQWSSASKVYKRKLVL